MLYKSDQTSYIQAKKSQIQISWHPYLQYGYYNTLPCDKATALVEQYNRDISAWKRQVAEKKKLKRERLPEKESILKKLRECDAEAREQPALPKIQATQLRRGTLRQKIPQGSPAVRIMVWD